MGHGYGLAITLANGRKLFLAVGQAYPQDMERRTEPSRWETVGRFLVSVLAVIGAVASAYYFLIHQSPRDPISSGVALCLSAFVYFAANHATISSFEAGPAGIKVLLRQAQEARQEAVATSQHLRAVASAVAKVGIELLVREGRFEDMPDVMRLDLKRELEGALIAIGMSPEEVGALTKFFRDFYARQHIGRVLDAAFKEYGKPAEDKPALGFKSTQEAIMEYVNLATDFRTPPDQLRIKLKARVAVTPAMEEALLDYAHFLKEGTFKRPERWAR
jgi:hypothetical protein